MSNLIIIFGFLIFFLVIISVIILKKEKKVAKEYKNIEKFAVGNILGDIKDIFKTTNDVFKKAKDISVEIPKLVKYLENIPQLLLKILKDGFGKMIDPLKDVFIKIIPNFVAIIGKIIFNIIIKVWEFLKKEVPEMKYITIGLYIFGIIQFLPIITMINNVLGIFISKTVSSSLIFAGITLFYLNLSTIVIYLTKTFVNIVMKLDYKDLIVDLSKMIVSELSSIFNQIFELISI